MRAMRQMKWEELSLIGMTWEAEGAPGWATPGSTLSVRDLRFTCKRPAMDRRNETDRDPGGFGGEDLERKYERRIRGRSTSRSTSTTLVSIPYTQCISL